LRLQAPPRCIFERDWQNSKHSHVVPIVPPTSAAAEALRAWPKVKRECPGLHPWERHTQRNRPESSRIRLAIREGEIRHRKFRVNEFQNLDANFIHRDLKNFANGAQLSKLVGCRSEQDLVQLLRRVFHQPCQLDRLGPFKLETELSIFRPIRMVTSIRSHIMLKICECC
jgi:hypothetical protein